MNTNTALRVLHEVHYDVNKLERFASIKHVSEEELTGEKTIVFNDDSYITIRGDESVTHGAHHGDISLNESMYVGRA